MDPKQPVPVLCRYLLKPGQEAEFQKLLDRHWPTLHEAGLTGDQPARVYRAGDTAGNVAFIEMFEWKDGSSAQTAHETAAVMEIWEPMGDLARDMEFWEITPTDG